MQTNSTEGNDADFPYSELMQSRSSWHQTLQRGIVNWNESYAAPGTTSLIFPSLACSSSTQGRIPTAEASNG